MRIRWKLFWLLAAISLVPLLLLRINSQFALSRLAERLSARVGEQLVTEAETRLRRLVEDHARILDARRQALALAVSLQATAARDLLARPTPPPLPPTDVITVAPAMGMGMGMRRQGSTDGNLRDLPGYYRLDQDGKTLPLLVDPDRLTLRLPPGEDRPQGPTLALAGLLPAYRQAATLVGPLAHFQATVLADGAAASYPATAGVPRRHDPRQAPWYVAALALPGPVWTGAQIEPGTGRVCVAVSTRLAGAAPGAAPAGVTVIFTPLDDLLASASTPGHIAADVETLLVMALSGPDDALHLVAQAGELREKHGHGWHAYVTPAPLTATDTAAFAAIAADVTAGVSGVRRLTYEGRDCLAAYAPTAQNEALMQIAPVADVLAAARAVTADVHDRIKRLYTFGAILVGTVMLALVIVSLSASRAVTQPIRALTREAGRLADGDFSARVADTGTDEIGELGRVFNDLAPRLSAHMRLREGIELASEVQRSLLPAKPPTIPGLALAGASRSCDETGGDYFDFLPFSGPKAGRLGVVLGDVSGHGLEAALLMTTARALLRPRAAAPGTPGEVLADVNRELTRDVYGTGRFMTLFYLEIDPVARTAAFARGGHDPAMRYDPATGRLDELTARGMALGVAEQARYETGHVAGLAPGQTICIGSDGLWEAENEAGEMFGKDRVRAILANRAADGPQAVLTALFTALDAFRGARPLDDDVTVVVVTLAADT